MLPVVSFLTAIDEREIDAALLVEEVTFQEASGVAGAVGVCSA